MMTLLTLTTMFGMEREHVPKVSYITFLDIWMVTCMAFVFITMVEFVVVNYLYRVKKTASGEFVEKLMQVLMPLCFIIFFILYWALLTKS
jgi:hypothetical protein